MKRLKPSKSFAEVQWCQRAGPKTHCDAMILMSPRNSPRGGRAAARGAAGGLLGGCGRLGLGGGKAQARVAAVASSPQSGSLCLLNWQQGLKNVRLNLFLAFKCVKETHNFIILFLSS